MCALAKRGPKALGEETRNWGVFRQHCIQRTQRDADVAGKLLRRHVEMRQHVLAQDFARMQRGRIISLVYGFIG